MDTLMTKAIAEHIKTLRTCKPHHSWRRVAEVVCERYPELPVSQGWELEGANGNQLYGIDLLKEAAVVLGESYQEWEEIVDKAFQ